VVTVTKMNVNVEQPKGFKPRTKRVARKAIVACWRRRSL
jgi:hypothetical protein